MGPQTDIAAVWDSYQNVVHVLREKGLTQGVTITSKYKDLQGESYQTEWAINPLLLEGSGYSKFKGYEYQVQALEDQTRAMEKISEDIKAAVDRLQERVSKDGES